MLSREHPTIFMSARERLGTRKLWIAVKKATNKRPVKVAFYPDLLNIRKWLKQLYLLKAVRKSL